MKRTINLTAETVETIVGIKGITADSFFSTGVLLYIDGVLFELTEICGDQFIFTPAWETVGNQKIAQVNFDFFNERANGIYKGY